MGNLTPWAHLLLHPPNQAGPQGQEGCNLEAHTMTAEVQSSSPRRSPGLQSGLWLARTQAHRHGVAGA